METTDTIRCYRFVDDDQTSAHGDMSWQVGEWNKVGGPVACCSSGLHASPTPRDSVRNVYGKRWFAAEARGEFSRQGHKFAASEMRLVEEIPSDVLRRFAIRCAEDGIGHIEQRRPLDARIRQCVEAAHGYLEGALGERELLDTRRAVGEALASGAVAGADVGRIVAAVLAASSAANGDAASWTAAAAAAAYAAHVAADAIEAAAALGTGQVDRGCDGGAWVIEHRSIRTITAVRPPHKPPHTATPPPRSPPACPHSPAAASR